MKGLKLRVPEVGDLVDVEEIGALDPGGLARGLHCPASRCGERPGEHGPADLRGEAVRGPEVRDDDRAYLKLLPLGRERGTPRPRPLTEKIVVDASIGAAAWGSSQQVEKANGLRATMKKTMA